MSLARFKALYSSNAKKGFMKQPYDEQDATVYWLKHKVNLLDLTQLLKRASFAERWVISELMDAAERKAAHWERHRNFDISRALTVFNAVKHTSRG